MRAIRFDWYEVLQIWNAAEVVKETPNQKYCGRRLFEKDAGLLRQTVPTHA